MRRNKFKLGLGVLTVLATPIAVNAVASNDAQAAQGWVKSGNAWYLYNQNGTLVRNTWEGNYWLGADGRMATNAWVDGGRYYVGSNGAWVKGAQNQAATNTIKQGWTKVGNAWYFYNHGKVVANAWIGNYWLGADGRMATNAWVDGGRYYVGTDGSWVKGAQHTTTVKNGWVKEGYTWYYYKNGSVVRNAWAGNYWLGADGRMATNSWVDNNRYYVGNDGAWIKGAARTASKSENTTNSNAYSPYYKVTSLYIPVYDANGRILSHVSKDTILFRDNRATVNGRIPVQVAGITGYVNSGQVAAVDSSTTFIPDYVSDGKYVYHRSNYTAADINRLYSLMGANNSKLAGKGATFKAAEQRYGVNALYLVAHSALESAWGRSQIARDKNNFFGIAAYDTTPYTSATKFDDVDSGILGAARWIDRNYLSNTGYPANGAYLGNKARGMNVNYATAPYWGESIASIMFSANEKLGRKDR